MGLDGTEAEATAFANRAKDVFANVKNPRSILHGLEMAKKYPRLKYAATLSSYIFVSHYVDHNGSMSGEALAETVTKDVLGAIAYFLVDTFGIESFEGEV